MLDGYVSVMCFSYAMNQFVLQESIRNMILLKFQELIDISCIIHNV